MKSKKNMVERAFRFATTAHIGQRDMNNRPACLHVLRVAIALSDDEWPDSVVAAAALHDTVEDTSVSLEFVEEEFGNYVMLLVDSLTHRFGETYFDYIDRIIISGQPSIAIKMADIRDNMNPDRVMDKHSLYTQWAKAYEKLKEARDR